MPLPKKSDFPTKQEFESILREFSSDFPNVEFAVIACVVGEKKITSTCASTLGHDELEDVLFNEISRIDNYRRTNKSTIYIKSDT